MSVVGPLLVLALLVPACSSPEPQKPAVMSLLPPAWVADADAGWDPAAQPGLLFATGRSPLHPDRAATAKRAEQDARKQLEPRVRQILGRLHDTFQRLHATELQPEHLQALRANDAASRALLATALGGARLKGQWEDDQTFFAWLGLDTLAVLRPAFEADLGARLAPLARELTATDREAFALVLAESAAGAASP